ncbi:MAG: glycosyltransferase [Actinobacteria bacterium]|nr:glycosyltransferase [Actinomycetota bacterium]
MGEPYRESPTSAAVAPVLRGAYFWAPGSFVWRGQRNNPYAGLLAAALRTYGVALEACADSDLGAIWRLRRSHRLLHFNWLPRFYEHPHPVWALLRIGRFAGALVLARLLGYRLVWTMHNLYPHEMVHPRYDRWARWLITRAAHAVICHCQQARALAIQHYGRRNGYHVIAHGTFQSAYPPRAGRELSRQALGVPLDAFVYGYFGNIRSYKGVERLLAIFRTVPDVDARLLVAGNPHRLYRGPLLEGIGGDARVLAHLRHIEDREIPMVMAACDVMVLPFVEALTSGSAILALGYGKPLVLPRVGCLPELIADPRCAVFYDPRDPDGLAQALRRARQFDLAQAERAALDRSRELNWDDIARQTLAAYGLAPPLPSPAPAASAGR